MNDYIAEITLDLNCEKSCKTLMLTQFDKGKKIRLKVTANGKPYPLTDCSVVMKGVNSDGSRAAITCEIEADGTATAVTDDVTFAVKGFAAARFVISDSERTYNTQRFLIYVDDSLDTDVMPEPDYSILNRLIRQVQLIDEHGGIIVDDELSGTSIHPVQNRVVNSALDTKASASNAFTFNDTTETVVYNRNNPKIIYLNAIVEGENGIVLTSKNNDFQYFFGRIIRIRYLTGDSVYSDWTPITEDVSNKKTAISNANKTSDTFYPSIKAVADYLSANYEATVNRLTSAEGIDINSTDTEYPTGKAVFDFGVQILDDIDGDITDINSALQSKENSANKQGSITNANKTSDTLYPSVKAVADYLSANYEATVNRLTSSEGIDINSTDTEYPTGKAVFDFGVQILDDIDDDITNINSSITQTNTALSDLKAYVGFTDGDILGLQCDFENRVFTRLGAAAGLLPGSDFNAFPMYGQRRRVVVNSDGEIQPDLDPGDITEGDTAYDVMVYQPKFYYKVVPLKLEKQSGGSGYHIRKANYYISSTPHAGFKLHPLFFDDNGNGVDYVLLSAYEASYLWDRQISTNGVLPTFFHDGVDSTATLDASAVLKSLPGVKPISGQTKPMTRANLELLAQRKSSNINGWHLDTIQSVSANQLLMAIEYASFNTQSVIGNGVVSCQNNGNNNCSSLTGSTSSLGNATGAAAKTVNDNAGTTTEFTENGKVAVSYRGMENPWGNIRKSVIGVNIWGNGTMNGGQVYICSDFNFNDLKHADNYLPCGFTISGVSGWISAFGYGSEDFDWLFMPSETNSNGADSALPVGDTAYSTANLNNHCAVHYGGHWASSLVAGGFGFVNSGVANHAYDYLGGRLLFVPKATV